MKREYIIEDHEWYPVPEALSAEGEDPRRKGRRILEESDVKKFMRARRRFEKALTAFNALVYESEVPPAQQ